MRPAPVVVDVNPDPDDLEWEQDFLERIEIPVIACGGPGASGKSPILEGRRCPKIEQADGVLFQLNLKMESSRSILQRYIELLDVPLRVVVSEEQRRRHGALLGNVEVFVPPIGPSKLDAFAAEVEHQ